MSSFSGSAARAPRVAMPQRVRVSAWSVVRGRTESGRGARVFASSPAGMMAVRTGMLRAREMAASMLVLTTMEAWMLRTRTAWRSFLESFSGGPMSFSVPAMSRIAQKWVSLLSSGGMSSTRGENWSAHSSRAARALLSSARERGSMATEGKTSSSARVVPASIPRVWARALREQTHWRGGVPSRTTAGLCLSWGRRRSMACAGNSRT